MKKCEEHKGEKNRPESCAECHVYNSKLGWTWCGTGSYFQRKEQAIRAYKPFSPRGQKMFEIEGCLTNEEDFVEENEGYVDEEEMRNVLNLKEGECCNIGFVSIRRVY